MPTLIRLIVGLLFLVGLFYAGMFALTVFVDPGEKEITVRIPARDLLPPREQAAPRPLTTAPPPAAPIAPGASTDTPE